MQHTLCAFLMQAWTPLEAAQAAGARATDVFMGIDVFGRGSYAGGQLNCNIAAAAARREGALWATHQE